MTWRCEAACSAFADVLWRRWSDVAGWREWDPDIESSSLQVAAAALHELPARASCALQADKFEAGATGIVTLHGGSGHVSAWHTLCARLQPLGGDMRL